MTTDTLLSRLENVRKRGAEQWSARCPAHDDKGPSLSVRALPDGRTLLHCFAGCGADEVLGAVGLDMAALFPPKAAPGAGATAVQRRHLLTAGQALDLLHDEAQLVALCAANLAHGCELHDTDLDRLLQAAGRVAYLRSEVLS